MGLLKHPYSYSSSSFPHRNSFLILVHILPVCDLFGFVLFLTTFVYNRKKFSIILYSFKLYKNVLSLNKTEVWLTVATKRRGLFRCCTTWESDGLLSQRPSHLPAPACPSSRERKGRACFLSNCTTSFWCTGHPVHSSSQLSTCLM